VQIDIPENCEISTIGAGAFRTCKNLTGFGINANSTKISTIGEYAFMGCESLTPDGIRFDSIDDFTKTTDSADGVCWLKTGELTLASSGCLAAGEIDIPEA
jgi:hypothetical protein